jgi:hypothetical protein
MTDTAVLLLALGFAGYLWVSWIVAARRARRSLAGVRLVTCPETERLAAVRFDLSRAARTALARHEPDAQLAECSRWAERGPCDQPCVPQARARESAVATIVARWSDGRECALCGKPLTEVPAVDRHIGVLASDGITKSWPDVPPLDVPEALRTGRPVCWSCHIAETFRREHPELVTDR